MSNYAQAGLFVLAREGDPPPPGRLAGIFSGVYQKSKALLALLSFLLLLAGISGAAVLGFWNGLGHLIASSREGAVFYRWLFCILLSALFCIVLLICLRLFRGRLGSLHEAFLASPSYGQRLLHSLQERLEQGERALGLFQVDDDYGNKDQQLGAFFATWLLSTLLLSQLFALYIADFEGLILSTILLASIGLSFLYLLAMELLLDVDCLGLTFCHGVLIIHAFLFIYLFPENSRPLLPLLFAPLIIEVFLLFRSALTVMRGRMVLLSSKGFRFIKLGLLSLEIDEPLSVASIIAKRKGGRETWRVNFTFGSFDEFQPARVKARDLGELAAAEGLNISVTEKRDLQDTSRPLLPKLLVLSAMAILFFFASTAGHFSLCHYLDFQQRSPILLKAPGKLHEVIKATAQHHPLSLSLNTALAQSFFHRGELLQGSRKIDNGLLLLGPLSFLGGAPRSHAQLEHGLFFRDLIVFEQNRKAKEAKGWEARGSALGIFRLALLELLRDRSDLRRREKGFRLLQQAKQLDGRQVGATFFQAMLRHRQHLEKLDGASPSELLNQAIAARERAIDILRELGGVKPWRGATERLKGMVAFPRADLLYFSLLLEYLQRSSLPSLEKVSEFFAKRRGSLLLSRSILLGLANAPPSSSRDFNELIETEQSSYPLKIENLSQIESEGYEDWFEENLQALMKRDYIMPSLPKKLLRALNSFSIDKELRRTCLLLNDRKSWNPPGKE